jgi:hypothetical protein
MTAEPLAEASAPSSASPGKRGEGRGSNFFVLDREHWNRLWDAPTANRLNLVTSFLVLLAGTGADHRLTKWSARACEGYAGMGKPRAKAAIAELISGGLAAHTEASRAMRPQYVLAEPQAKGEPIFLPVQLITSLGAETPILRRVRETGDEMLLRMLIDLYGLIQTDAAYGVSLANLRLCDNASAGRKVIEMGANAVWAIQLSETANWVGGDWYKTHKIEKAKGDAAWVHLWERLRILQTIGALVFEPWIFDGEAWDAEPLYPAEAGNKAAADAQRIASLAADAATELAGDRTYLIERNADSNFVIVPAHHRPPAIRGVAKLRVEADTPGRRLAYAKRKQAVETQIEALESVVADSRIGRHDRPIRLR